MGLRVNAEVSFEQEITEGTELRSLRYLLFKTYFRVKSLSLFAKSCGKAFRLRAVVPNEFRGRCWPKQNLPTKLDEHS